MLYIYVCTFPPLIIIGDGFILSNFKDFIFSVSYFILKLDVNFLKNQYLAHKGIGGNSGHLQFVKILIPRRLAYLIIDQILLRTLKTLKCLIWILRK